MYPYHQNPKTFFEWVWENLVQLFYISFMIGGIAFCVWWVLENIEL